MASSSQSLHHDDADLDVSSFPLIRIDQISKFRIDSLQKCEVELVPLVAQLSENSLSPANSNIEEHQYHSSVALLSYSRRLLEIVRDELCNRSSAVASVSRSSNDEHFVMGSSQSEQNEERNCIAQRRSFVQVPLPSEIKSLALDDDVVGIDFRNSGGWDGNLQSKRTQTRKNLVNSPRASHFSRRSSNDRNKKPALFVSTNSNSNGGLRNRTKSAIASLRKKTVASVAAKACERKTKERLARRARASERVRVLTNKKEAREEGRRKAAKQRKEQIQAAVEAMERFVKG